MNGLGSWLKEIIMIILLATFLDLLLPNRSMQRYVKLTLSLIILLTMLSPVLKLFDIKMMDQLEKEWAKWFSTSKVVHNRSATVENIKHQGEMLAQRHVTSALQLAEEEIGKQMKEQLTVALRHAHQAIPASSKLSDRVQVERLKVKLVCHAKGEPIIERIELVLASEAVLPVTSSVSSAPNKKIMADIKPIKSVQIKAGVSDPERFPSVFTQPNDSEAIGTERAAKSTEVQHFRKQATARAIQSLLSAWTVNRDQIFVDWL